MKQGVFIYIFYCFQMKKGIDTALLGLIIQITSIIIGVAAIFAPIFYLISLGYFSMIRFFVCALSIVNGLILVLSEFYAVPFFKYMMFVFTYWGKAFLLIFNGLVLFNPDDKFRLAMSIIFWIFGVVFIILYFCGFNKISPPLFQRKAISISMKERDCFD